MSEFEEYWADLREATPRSKGKEVDSTAFEAFRRWVSDPDSPNRPPFVVVSGSDRDIAFRHVQAEERMFEPPGNILDLRGGSTSWVGGLTRHLVDRIRSLHIPPEFRDTPMEPPLPHPEDDEWDILWGLIAAPSLVMEGTLKEHIDSPLSRPKGLLFETYRELVAARKALSLFAESKAPNESAYVSLFAEPNKSAYVWGLVQSLGQWIVRPTAVRLGPTTTDVRFEAVQFLCTLAKQNGLLGNRVILAIDGLENLISRAVAEELYYFLSESRRWEALGSPLNLVIGWRGTQEDARRLSTVHPRLAKRILKSHHSLICAETQKNSNVEKIPVSNLLVR